jgi:hypothetical protein
MSWWTAGAIVGSALIGSSASRSAGESQAGAAREASALSDAQFQQTRQDQAPFLQAGVRALGKLEGISDYTPFAYDEFTRDPGYAFRLKEGQKASFQLSLFEIEDYQPAKKWVNRFNAVSGVLAIPLALSSAENPVSWFLWGMKASSFGLDWVSELDKQDLLGVSETQWAYETANSSFRSGKWMGGRKLIDAYEYQYTIQINVE